MNPKIDRLLFLLAVIVLVLLSPYFVWGHQLFFFRFSYSIGILIMLFIIFNYHRSEIFNPKLVLLFALVSLYTMVGILRFNALSYIPLLALLFIALKPEEQLRVFDYFVTLLTIIYVVGMLSYVFRFFGINLQLSTLSSPNPGRNPYIIFFGHIEESGVQFWRFSSIFDEAGVVGTINGAIISVLGISKHNIKSLVIFFTGLISFSLAFYIILFINILFILGYKKSLLIVTFLTLFALISGDKFKELIASRISFENGRLVGDNRTHQEFESYFNLFLARGGDDFVFGIGPDFDKTIDEEITTGISSYKTMIISFGIFGFALIICFYFFSVYDINNSRKGWLLAIVFILIAYQRPSMLKYYNIVLFIGGLRYLRNYADEIDNHLNDNNQLNG